MKKLIGYRFGSAATFVFSCVMLAFLFCSVASTAKAEPPKDQTYVGSKKCASCHFDQYLKWKKTGHAKGFEVLTAKYQKDEKCLKCHTTGHGQPSGFQDMVKTRDLAGITCESCHGPGSKHDEIAQQFKGVSKLNPEQEALVRGSIWKLLPQNVCITCHNQQAHKESMTPPELRKP